MKSIKVIKIGGKVIDDEHKLGVFLREFVQVKEPKILVHGGGSIASKIGEQMGLQTKLIDGRRVTDSKTLEMITMVYGGLINKRIVAKMQSLGINALGLSGADLNIISANKRPSEPIDYGWVGDISNVNTTQLSQLLKQGITPVLAPLTHNNQGNILNTNADTIASEVASALSYEYKTELLLCFEQRGVMYREKLISKMNLMLYRHLKDTGIINNGMIPKIDVGFHALRKGVDRVCIRNFCISDELKSGTILVKN